MEIKQTAVAGTLESSDIMVTIHPSEAHSVTIQLESNVEKQFGKRIREVMEATLKNLGVTSAEVIAVDKGALDGQREAGRLLRGPPPGRHAGN